MTTDTVGGVWHYALELARALAAQGITTALAAVNGPPGREERGAAAAIPGLELFEGNFRLEWMDDAWGDVARAGDWLLDLEARVRPDIIHLNGYCHGALPWRAPCVMVAHSCVLSWWHAVHDAPAPPGWDRYRAEVGRGLAAASIVVAPTAAMLRSLATHYGVSAVSAGRVISNARDRRRFYAAPKERFVFAAGRLWDPAKDLAALAAAAPSVSWPILVAGSEAHPDGERAGSIPPALRAGWDRGLCALGWMAEDDLARWMARAAVYAHPARYEPFGLSILEAALSGCALVLGGIPSLREVWGDAAVFVPPGDAGALAAAVQRLIDDAPLRAVMGTRARRRAVRFSPLVMARRYLDAYGDALADIPTRGRARPRPLGAPRVNSALRSGSLDRLQ